LNIKGGVGKTTSSLNIAAGLADKGKRVLFIDYDKQGNASKFFQTSSEVTIGDVMAGYFTIDKAMYKVEDNFYFVPSAMDIKQVEIDLQRDPKGARHDILRSQLYLVKDQFDYCIIDCHPDMNILIINAIYASDYLIIVIKPEPFAIDGFQNTLEDIVNFRKVIDLPIEPYILFAIVTRIKDEQLIMKTVTEMAEDKVFNTRIRYQNAPVVRAAIEKKMVIRSYFPIPGIVPGVAKDLREVVDEILRRFPSGT